MTYDDENLPYGGTLVPDHLSEFVRRWRRRIGAKKLRYFGVGEYGDSFGRPHYHLIAFGPDIPDRKIIAERQEQNSVRSSYESELLQDAWNDRGFVQIEHTSPDTMAYVAGYVIKKITGAKAEEHYTKLVEETGEIIQLEPEFCRQSTRPGIGHDYFHRYADEIVRDDNVIRKGKRIPTPRYYEKLLKKANPEQFAKFKARREEKGKQIDQLDNTRARRAVKNHIATRNNQDRITLPTQGRFRHSAGMDAGELTRSARNAKTIRKPGQTRG